MPPMRAVIQPGIFLKDGMVLNAEALLILAQLYQSNVQFCSPMSITDKSMINKVKKLKTRVTENSSSHVHFDNCKSNRNKSKLSKTYFPHKIGESCLFLKYSVLPNTLHQALTLV